MSDSVDIFDLHLYRVKKAKAEHTFARADFLARDIETTLLHRLVQLNRSFASVLVLGCPAQHLQATMSKTYSSVTYVDLVDREALPFQDQVFDLVIDGFGLHWVNHVPRALFDVGRVLRPGGIYLAGFLGEQTLTELRQVLLKTDLALFQGAFARVSPFLKVQTISSLLLAAGFHNPVVDHEELEVHYVSILDLIADLRAMGETNCLKGESAPYRRDYFHHANRLYQDLFATPHGKIKATFDCVYFIGEKRK